MKKTTQQFIYVTTSKISNLLLHAYSIHARQLEACAEIIKSDPEI